MFNYVIGTVTCSAGEERVGQEITTNRDGNVEVVLIGQEHGAAD
jgi:hypothetical protein